jgi:hypothetical protein
VLKLQMVLPYGWNASEVTYNQSAFHSKTHFSGASVTLRVHPWAAKLPEISRRVIRSATSPASSDEEPYLVIVR